MAIPKECQKCTCNLRQALACRRVVLLTEAEAGQVPCAQYNYSRGIETPSQTISRGQFGWGSDKSANLGLPASTGKSSAGGGRFSRVKNGGF